jgi:hypothetical protein
MYKMHTGEYPIDFSLGYDDIVRQIKEGVPRMRAESLGTPIGQIASVMLRRQEQYRYTSPAQAWDDLRKLDVWGGSRGPDSGPHSSPGPRSSPHSSPIKTPRV